MVAAHHRREMQSASRSVSNGPITPGSGRSGSRPNTLNYCSDSKYISTVHGVVFNILCLGSASHPLRIERGRPQGDVGAVAERHRHLPAGTVDLDVTEELHAG